LPPPPAPPMCCECLDYGTAGRAVTFDCLLDVPIANFRQLLRKYWNAGIASGLGRPPAHVSIIGIAAGSTSVTTEVIVFDDDDDTLLRETLGNATAADVEAWLNGTISVLSAPELLKSPPPPSPPPPSPPVRTQSRAPDPLPQPSPPFFPPPLAAHPPSLRSPLFSSLSLCSLRPRVPPRVAAAAEAAAARPPMSRLRLPPSAARESSASRLRRRSLASRSSRDARTSASKSGRRDRRRSGPTWYQSLPRDRRRSNHNRQHTSAPPPRSSRPGEAVVGERAQRGGRVDVIWRVIPRHPAAAGEQMTGRG
jgi:hypothetical protein